MSPRDWFEIAWHAALILFALPSVLGILIRNPWARAAVAVVVVVALAYHVTVVQACHDRTSLCYWGQG